MTSAWRIRVDDGVLIRFTHLLIRLSASKEIADDDVEHGATLLKLDGDWVWDFWIADDGDRFHVFYLHAPRSLGDPEKRHRHARIGHATSHDLVDWTVLSDPFGVGELGSFDETATWTGSVVQGDDGLWRMFYTGARFLGPWPELRNVESVGVAISADLHQWHKQPGSITGADPRWYETLGTSSWREEAWRDPWVYRDDTDGLWHMLVTARSGHGPIDDRGVIGHATSDDLAAWTVQPPMTRPGLGFQHMEVPQLIVGENGARTILFSCGHGALADRLRMQPDADAPGGVWALPVSPTRSSTGLSTPVLVLDEHLYSARVVRDRAGALQMLAFESAPLGETFVGGLTDPMPVALDELGVPHLLHAPASR